jgi:hypothetical protein
MEKGGRLTGMVDFVLEEDAGDFVADDFGGLVFVV